MPTMRNEASRRCSAEISLRLDKRGHLIRDEPMALVALYGLSYGYVLKLIAEERKKFKKKGRR